MHEQQAQEQRQAESPPNRPLTYEERLSMLEFDTKLRNAEHDKRTGKYDELTNRYEKQEESRQFIKDELGKVYTMLGLIKDQNSAAFAVISGKVDSVYYAVFGDDKQGSDKLEGSLMWRMKKIEDKYKLPGVLFIMLIQVATLVTLLLSIFPKR